MMREDDETKWIAKASEAIKAAKAMNDPLTKAPMLAIAKAYMKLAIHARDQAQLWRKSKLFC
ncbi:MAG: hypothetical protein WBX25_01680 [Rhodomicrobium sp.]